MTTDILRLPVADLSPVVTDALAIPCRREERGGSHLNATWAAWIRETPICCNPSIPMHEQPMFICDPCCDKWRSTGITCPHCGAFAGDFNEIITRLERIDS